MEVVVSHSGIANTVAVSASVPNIVTVQGVQPINVEVQLYRDGRDGVDGIDGKDGTDAVPAQIDGGLIF